MSELNYKKIDVLSLSLDGFEGPIDLLLSLARDHKIDLTKLSILTLAEQYLEFLDQIIKKDIDIAAEYLVMGAWLAFLKSKLLLPDDKEGESMTSEEMSELLEFQMKRLEEIVAALEAGGTDLDETLKLFEEGSKLLKSCQEELAEAEGKVEKLRLEDVE